MMRITAAVPAVPSTITGIQRCDSRSSTRAQDHGAFTNSGLNRPPTDCPKTLNEIYSSTSASRKFGIASPMKPRKVNT